MKGVLQYEVGADEIRAAISQSKLCTEMSHMLLPAKLVQIN